MSVDDQLTEICCLLEDTNVELRKKIATVLTLPRSLEMKNLTDEKCEKLFNSVPVEVLDCVLNSEEREFQDGKPIVAHVLSFCCQSTSQNVYERFKPVVTNLVKLVTPKNKLPTTFLNDIAVVVTYMPYKSGEQKIIYDFLRQITSFFISQNEQLEVEVFLSICRLILSKIFSTINVGDDASTIDTRVWPVGILSIVRNLLKEKTEKMNEETRVGVWDLIGSICRLIGPSWFALDEQFAKLVAQMNTVEIQMCLHTADSIVAANFARHLRVLEVFICAIHDDEIFNDSSSFNDVLLAVGSGTKYVLLFWSEAALTNIELADEVLLNLFTFSVFLLSRGEFEMANEKTQKQLAGLILTEALKIVENSENIEDVSHLFAELFDKLTDLITLDDRVPIIVAKYLMRLRDVQRRDQWKLCCIETTVALMELRGRVDWYSRKSIEEANNILEEMNEDDKPDVSSLISLFEKLPKIK